MRQYNCHVDADMVLAISRTLGTPETEVLAFFDDALEQMYKCPPNLTRRPYSRKNDSSGKIDDKIWILRGYYPNTGIFFKVVLVESKTNWSDEKSLWSSVKAAYPAKKRVIAIDSKYIRGCIADNVLVGEPLPNIDIKPQRLLTPKGMKPFRFKKRK